MKTQSILIFSALFLMFFSGCLKEEPLTKKAIPIDIAEEAPPPPSSNRSECGCENLVTYEGNLPVYASVDSFFDALDCLTNCVDQHNIDLSEEHSELSNDEYNDLFDNGQADEWAPLASFREGLVGRTLFEKEEEFLDDWLDEDDLDWETYPTSELSPIGAAMSSMINEDCEAIINGELVNLCEDLVLEEGSRELEWCTPFGFSSGQKTQGNRRIIVNGGMSKVAGISFIIGRVRNFKFRNGRFRRNRVRLCVSTGCTIRRSPIAEESCGRLAFMDSGTKCKNNRSSLSAIRINNYNAPFTWYKKTRNAGPDGSAYGSNGFFALSVGY